MALNKLNAKMVSKLSKPGRYSDGGGLFRNGSLAKVLRISESFMKSACYGRS